MYPLVACSHNSGKSNGRFIRCPLWISSLNWYLMEEGNVTKLQRQDIMDILWVRSFDIS